MVFYPDIKAFLIQQHPKMQANGVREDSTPTHFGNRYGLFDFCLFLGGGWVWGSCFCFALCDLKRGAVLHQWLPSGTISC